MPQASRLEGDCRVRDFFHAFQCSNGEVGLKEGVGRMGWKRGWGGWVGRGGGEDEEVRKMRGWAGIWRKDGKRFERGYRRTFKKTFREFSEKTGWLKLWEKLDLCKIYERL